MGGLFNIGHTFVTIIIILGHLCVFFNTFTKMSDMFFLTLKVTKYNDQRVATCFGCMCYSKNNIGKGKLNKCISKPSVDGHSKLLGTIMSWTQ
jgi:hypothetical protein